MWLRVCVFVCVAIYVERDVIFAHVTRDRSSRSIAIDIHFNERPFENNRSIIGAIQESNCAGYAMVTIAIPSPYYEKRLVRRHYANRLGIIPTNGGSSGRYGTQIVSPLDINMITRALFRFAGEKQRSRGLGKQIRDSVGSFAAPFDVETRAATQYARARRYTRYARACFVGNRYLFKLRPS